MGAWIVKYTWHRSMYFDSPLYNAEELEGFDTHDQAKEWADSPHPDLPGFRVIDIYKNFVPKTRKDNYNTCVPRGGLNSDRNTDVCILGMYKTI